MADDDDTCDMVAASAAGGYFYLLEADKKCLWVHNVLRHRHKFSEFHRLAQELRLDAHKFHRYFRMSIEQFVARQTYKLFLFLTSYANLPTHMTCAVLRGERLGGVHAFGSNSAESDSIWMKSLSTLLGAGPGRFWGSIRVVATV